MKILKFLRARHLILVTLGSANLFLFQNCSNYSGQVMLQNGNELLANKDTSLIGGEALPESGGSIEGISSDSSESFPQEGVTTVQIESPAIDESVPPESMTNNSPVEPPPPKEETVVAVIEPPSAPSRVEEVESNPESKPEIPLEVSEPNESNETKPVAEATSSPSPSPTPEVVASEPVTLPPPSIEVPPPTEEADSCDLVAEQNTCSKANLSVAKKCDDEGADDSSDSSDVNECLGLRDSNIRYGKKELSQLEFRSRHKNILVTHEPIEKISGRGKLVIIYDGPSGRGKIKSIEGFKGKLIVCGFDVEKAIKTRGRVVLVNSNIDRIEYLRGRIISSQIEKLGEKSVGVKRLSVLKGGHKSMGVYSIFSGQIAKIAGAEGITTEAVKNKVALAHLKESIGKEQKEALEELEAKLKSMEKSKAKKDVKEKLYSLIKNLRESLKSIEVVKAEVTFSDDDLDCDQDDNKVLELETIRKWKNYTERELKPYIKKQREEGRKYSEK